MADRTSVAVRHRMRRATDRGVRASELLAYDGEWRTLLLAMAVYAGWAATLLAHRRLAWWGQVGALAWFGAWHLSLQHETIHGHPFRDRRLGHALGWLPLTLWLPYDLYRSSHLAHHAADLTDPIDDPESYYVTAERLAAAGRPGRAVLWMNRTLAFRVLVWSAISVVAYLAQGAADVARARPGARRSWLAHAAGATAVLGAVTVVAGVPLWQYLLGAVYGARALNLVRSFAEHRWTPDGTPRTAVVDAGPVLRLLHLNLNLHLAHHDAPGEPWYRLPEVAARTGAAARAARGAGHYPGGYAEIVRRYAFRPLDPPTHPAPERR